MATNWEGLLEDDRRRGGAALQDDYDHVARQLARRGIDIAAGQVRATVFAVAVPSWGVATGGTRFARFPGPGESWSMPSARAWPDSIRPTCWTSRTT